VGEQEESLQSRTNGGRELEVLCWPSTEGRRVNVTCVSLPLEHCKVMSSRNRLDYPLTVYYIGVVGS
jgi:hypothetical protein